MPSFCPDLVQLRQQVEAIKVKMKTDSQNLLVREEYKNFYSFDLSLSLDYTNNL